MFTSTLGRLESPATPSFVACSLNGVRLGRTVMIAVELICMVTIFAIYSPLKAQSFYGSILGTVKDSSGALVPDATVTVTNIGTNERQRVQSSREGNYSTVNLVPATYNVEVAKAGFRRFLIDQVTMGVGAVVRVDAVLVVGAVSETLEVTGEAPLLQTDTSAMSEEIDRALVRDLPLNGRNVMNLIALVPGVVPAGSSTGSTGLNQGTRTSNQGWGNYQIGGAIQGQSAEYVDGSPINVLGGNTVALVMTQDAVQELSVVTSDAGRRFRAVCRRGGKHDIQERRRRMARIGVRILQKRRPGRQHFLQQPARRSSA